MARVVFFGKPGCQGNARQVELLRASGHVVELRDLRAGPWTAATLRPFFGDMPVADWFNRSAPAVVRGEMRPEALDEPTALSLLLAAPLLIRRPLLQVGERRMAGFVPEAIGAWIGLAAGLPPIGEGCPRR
ncbi:hypothetical protein M0638_11330 [Roseomonas sp. NAR14]|uniref:Nitrogenase-associated protein n=1 Tax=Roseomonas acroporae TaxID=2937791 RepID=A0A9X1Y6Q1_9PROT|nr:ArsC/Spx/MgsR family protein [Roseomonas acroporae]MCK8784974.1 hypothetical protein [Roseomonas acroporae]